MLASFALILWSSVAAIVVKVVVSLIRHERLKRQMPPGPPGLPFLGNLLRLNKHPWLVFEELKEQYGEQR